jgi:hypothetical protein
MAYHAAFCVIALLCIVLAVQLWQRPSPIAGGMLGLIVGYMIGWITGIALRFGYYFYIPNEFNPLFVFGDAYPLMFAAAGMVTGIILGGQKRK